MPHAQQQRDLIAALHLESLFKAANFLGLGERSRHVAVAADTLVPDRAGQLADLIRHLDLPPDTAASPCLAQSDAAVARALESIEAWMTYLPANCVKSMVHDGWQWTT